MNNVLLLLEDDLSEFNQIVGMFVDWDIYPKNHTDINYVEKNSTIEYIKDKVLNQNVTALIMDISLHGSDDEEGLTIIREIRNTDNIKFLTIPIYCLSHHGKQKNIRQKAFSNGATNIFHKGDFTSGVDFDSLNLSIRALSMNYLYAVRHPFTPELRRELNGIHENLKNTVILSETILGFIVNKSDYDEILNIREINEESASQIEKVIGGADKLSELMQTKMDEKNMNKIEESLGMICEYFSYIPYADIPIKIIKFFLLLNKTAVFRNKIA
jgi:hypothetical protein